MRKFLLSLVAVCLLAVPTYGQISGPDEVNLNKPIVFKSENVADVYFWDIDEPAEKVQVGNGQEVHVWAPEGEYKIGLRTIKIDWDKKLIQAFEFSHDFVIGEPEPKPGPDPIPVPVPTGFKAKVKAAFDKVPDSGRQYTDKVANVYLEIANQAEANPNAWDAATMVNQAKVDFATKLPVSALNDWKPFWEDLAKALVELDLDSSDLNGHIKAFKEIVEVIATTRLQELRN